MTLLGVGEAEDKKLERKISWVEISVIHEEDRFSVDDRFFFLFHQSINDSF
jgi:hypothetical protein